MKSEKLQYCLIGFLFLAILSSAYAEETLELTPQKVRDLALSQGLAVRLAHLELEATETILPQAKSQFDTNLNLEGSHQIDKSARTSTFFGNRTDISNWNVGINRLMPTGTKFDVQFLNQRTKVFGANALIGIPSAPTYEPIIEMGVTQSLGKNFAGRMDRREVSAAEAQVATSDFQTQQVVSEILADAESLYWNWIVAGHMKKIALESLNRGEKFLSITRKKTQSGIVERTALLGGQALVARREAQLEEAKVLHSFWETKLKEALQIPSPLSLSSPPLGERVRVRGKPKTLSEEISFALENRADFLSQKERARQKDIELKIAKDSLWPSIDLAGTIQLNEISVGSYSDAVQGMDSPVWQAGIQIQIPLENRFARSQRDRANYEKAREVIALKQFEDSIEKEVGHVMQVLAWREKRFASQKNAKEWQEKKLKLATGDYQRGRLSAELMIQFEDDYLAAERDWLQAALDYQQSRINWELSRKTVFDKTEEKK